MRRTTVILSLATMAAAIPACLTEGGSPKSRCNEATQRVAQCYGNDFAAEFAIECDATAADTALAESCPDAATGKADGWGTYIDPDGEAHFKYGSIGTDWLGLPAPIFRALPVICEDLLIVRSAFPSAIPHDWLFRVTGVDALDVDARP